MRPIYEIARDIRKAWAKPNYAATPYLDAMRDLDSIHDNYYLDSGKSIVAYFLSNAATFKGPEAKTLKEELKALLKAA